MLCDVLALQRSSWHYNSVKRDEGDLQKAVENSLICPINSCATSSSVLAIERRTPSACRRQSPFSARTCRGRLTPEVLFRPWVRHKSTGVKLRTAHLIVRGSGV